jgi:hypothetical protein
MGRFLEFRLFNKCFKWYFVRVWVSGVPVCHRVDRSQLERGSKVGLPF